MAQMRVQLTSPYGTVTRTFSEYDRDVATYDDGTTLVIYDVIGELLNQAEQVTHEQQGELLAWSAPDGSEVDVLVARTTTIFGRRSLEIETVHYQDPGLYVSGDPDIELLETVGYDLSDLPFEVTIEDVTGQLYDEYKEA